MAPLSPRDVHVALVGGCGIIGVVLALIGTLDFIGAFNVGPNQPVFLLEGAVWLGLGGGFVLSSIVLHAWRQIRLASSDRP